MKTAVVSIAVVAILGFLAIAATARAAQPAGLVGWPKTDPGHTYSRTIGASHFYCQLWLYRNGYIERCTLIAKTNAQPRGAASARLVWGSEGIAGPARLRRPRIG